MTDDSRLLRGFPAVNYQLSTINYIYCMNIAEIISHLESLAHPSLQEHYDNAGLITGSPAWACTGMVVSLDATEEVVLEARQKGCNLVVSHHPIVFGGLKRLNGSNYVGKAVIAAIKNDIALY